MMDGRTECRIYCHIVCDAVNYEWKYTQEHFNGHYKRVPLICAFSKVPKGIVVFDCYFKILSKPIIKPPKFKSHPHASYRWELTEKIIEDMLNNVGRRFYSPNFMEGCYCLSMYNNKMHPNDACRRLKIQLVLLNEECVSLDWMSKTFGLEGHFKVLGDEKDNQCYQRAFDKTTFMNDNTTIDTDMHIDRDFVVKFVEVSFRSYSS